jgi:hypothetical protein
MECNHPTLPFPCQEVLAGLKEPSALDVIASEIDCKECYKKIMKVRAVYHRIHALDFPESTNTWLAEKRRLSYIASALHQWRLDMAVIGCELY